MSGLWNMENLAALLTLAAMEIVLGIDNLVFLSLVTARVTPAQRAQARRVGLLLAMGMRILLLLGITWIMRLVTPLFAVLGHAVSGRDLILLAGGAFLVGKGTAEIHDRLEGPEAAGEQGAALPFGMAVAQIVALDVVFSLDSVITAVGMARSLTVMIAAIVAAVAVMIFFSGAVSRFIEQHPTMKMLALAFLLLIGVVLVMEGMGRPIERGYVYFAMAFSFGVELLNLRWRRGAPPVHLHERASVQERP